MNTTDCTALLAEAHLMLANIELQKAKNTAILYQRIVSRMERCGKTPEQMAQAANSYYVYRAALIHDAGVRLAEALMRIEKEEAMKRSKAGQSDKHLDSTYDEIRQLLEQLRRYPPDPQGRHRMTGVKSLFRMKAEKDNGDDNRNGKKMRSRRSKKYRLAGLPDDWRDRFFMAVPRNSRYREIVAVLSLTGCRPQEIEQGVALQVLPGSLRFSIRGAKRRGGRYGADRAFCVPIGCAASRYLADQYRGQATVTISGQAGAISDRLSQMSRDIFPDLRGRSGWVSAYCFRHQMAADLKAQGFADEALCAVMGHCSDTSRGHYASGRSGRSRRDLTDIVSDREARIVQAEGRQRLPDSPAAIFTPLI